MYAGRLDRFIDIQRAQITQSPSGAPVTTWVNLATRRPASVDQRRDVIETTPGGLQVVALNQLEFRIRYASAVAGLTPKDRVIYPASSSLPSAVYNVLAVTEIGRREGLRIIAEAHSDAG